MNADTEISIFKALDFIRDNAPKYAKAKSERVYLEEFRKSKKAMLMQEAEINGHKSAVAQEREAYAHADYMALLEGLKAAVEQEESLRWLIVGAQAKIDVWRTIEANRRIEAKTL
jgi:benzoyl-CoA reductase/2-hydroxyglutaryl-CoA dehydratase subunit BcrC/BadD/HgdB